MTNIPKIIHFIWLGPKPRPGYFKSNIEKCQALNPDFKINIWSEDSLTFDCTFVKSAYMVRQWARAANYFRLQLLEKYGGIYLDCDVEPRRPFHTLLNHACFLGFQETSFSVSCVNNAVIGALPGHWFIREAKARLCNSRSGIGPVDDSTGPQHLTKILIENGLSAPTEFKTCVRDIALYPPRYFYPFHWTKSNEACGDFPDAFSVHHWAASWIRPKSILVRAADWATSTLPLYWRIDRRLRPIMMGLRCNESLLAPIAMVIAKKFDWDMKRGCIRSSS